MESQVSPVDEYALVTAYLAPQEQPGVMIDVGAWKSPIQPFLESGWKVFAFEPDDANRSELNEMQKRYPSLLHVDGRAVATETKEGLPFYRSTLSPGISGLQPFDPSHKETGCVNTISLGDFCKEQDIRNIDLLKIDTEGYDLPVLRGADVVSIPPRVILCEFEDRKTAPLGYTWRDMVSWLQDRGYTVLLSEWYPVVKYGGGQQWREWHLSPSKLRDGQSWGNILAFRDAVDWEAILNAVAQRCGLKFARLEKALNDRKKDILQLQGIMQSLQEDLASLRDSRSWRWTAWLRGVERGARVLQSGFKRRHTA